MTQINILAVILQDGRPYIKMENNTKITYGQVQFDHNISDVAAKLLLLTNSYPKIEEVSPDQLEAALDKLLNGYPTPVRR